MELEEIRQCRFTVSFDLYVLFSSHVKGDNSTRCEVIGLGPWLRIFITHWLSLGVLTWVKRVLVV